MSNRVIDSHLHVWASQSEASNGFPYVQEPPESLRDRASTDELLKHMADNGIDGALIVQPINHKYDHSYVLQAMKTHPDKFKGMLLHDPSLSAEDGVARLEELSLQGFVGVRYNPYLWPKVSEDPPKWASMSEGVGLAVYKRCGELGMPVGVMCFQGLDLHYDDIVALLDKSPQTKLILDHFGFTSLDKPETFDLLLSLAAKYPQVYVKVSALFRQGDTSPYDRVRDERLVPLLQAFGSSRLLFGSDFPFVLEQPEGYGTNQLVASWLENEDDRNAIMGGTVEQLFGVWNSK